MTLHRDIETSVPRIPDDQRSPWAWIEARIVQLIEIAGERASSIDEAWVELNPATLAHPSVTAALIGEITTENEKLPVARVEAHSHVVDVVLVADDAMYEKSFVVSFSTGDAQLAIATSAVHGFCYDSEVTAEVVTTRWVLEHDDELNPFDAATIAERV